MREIPELDDASMTIDEWIKAFTLLQAAHGGDTVVYVDAGYNNVSFVIKE